MLAKKTTWSIVVVLVIAGMLQVGQSVSEPGQPGQRKQGAYRKTGKTASSEELDTAQMRQMRELNMKMALEVTDTKWKVLGPRVMKVRELAHQVAGWVPGMVVTSVSRADSGGVGGGPVGRPGGRSPVRMSQEPTEEEKAKGELLKTVRDTSATPDAIKKQLTTLRAAREKVKQELAKAQRDLRLLLTLRQEAMLVLMGMLD